MSTSTVDTALVEQVAAYDRILAGLDDQDASNGMERATIEGEREQAVLAGEDTSSYRDRLRRLREEADEIARERAIVVARRQPMVAAVEAQQRAERAAHEYETAAEAHVQALNALAHGQRAASSAVDEYVVAVEAALASLIATVTAVDGLQVTAVQSRARVQPAAAAVGAPPPHEVPDAVEAMAAALDLRHRPVLMAARRGDRAGVLQAIGMLISVRP